MHDIKYIRENPIEFDAQMKRRGVSPIADKIIELDIERRKTLTNLQLQQSKRNQISKEFGKEINDSEKKQQLITKVSELKKSIPELEKKENKLLHEIKKIIMELPNLLDDSVPPGLSENENKLIRQVGNVPKFDFLPKDHVEIGEILNQMDFNLASKMSGARFVVLKGQLAKLERALANFMLDVHTNEFGYLEGSPPFLVWGNALEGTGQLPKFESDLFQTTDKRWLIPTAEVPLTNFVNNSILNYDDLPLRFTAFTPCFRSEAGASGKDTRGMIRQHQFSKVELVSICSKDKSNAELEYMTNCAENILKKLDLPYRVVKLCAGDTGFSASQTLDIEVWLPGQKNNDGTFGCYREISSCSNCKDFQSRRMKARIKSSNENSEFVHTLNGSALAVGRTMIAIIENYQQENGTVLIPKILQPYTSFDKIEILK